MRVHQFTTPQASTLLLNGACRAPPSAPATSVTRRAQCLRLQFTSQATQAMSPSPIVSMLRPMACILFCCLYLNIHLTVNRGPGLEDGLVFEVDGVESLPLTTHTTNFDTHSHALTPGVHVLRWSFVKDSSYSLGEDAAFIEVSFLIYLYIYFLSQQTKH